QESLFHTAKYQPDYPGRFRDTRHGRHWCHDFFGWYNDDHHHEGLSLFTPADVFFGRVALVAARRQEALRQAFEAHPERFVRGLPRVRLPPTSVAINRLEPDPQPVTADRILSARDAELGNPSSNGVLHAESPLWHQEGLFARWRGYDRSVRQLGLVEAGDDQ